jgi:PAS domain S-box-containing protein
MNVIQNEQFPRTDDKLQHERRVLQIELEMQNEELRRVQVELEATRDRYIELYEFAPIGYLTLTRDGIVSEANLTCTSLLGVNRKELLNRRFDGFITASDKDRWNRHFVNLVGLVGRKKCELLIQRKDGSTFHAQLDCQKLNADDSPLTRIALTDLSERKLAEAERDSLLKIIEDSSDYIGTADLQGHLLFHNVAARRMIGLPDDADMSSLKINEMHPGWAAKIVLNEGIPIALRQGFWLGESAVLNRDGHEIPVSQMIRLHYDAFGKPQFLSTIMRDITEPKRLEQLLVDNVTKLETAKVLAEKANLAKSDFISSMSHELRTPLNAILGFSQLLEAGSPPPMLSQVLKIQQIAKAGWYLLELINEILDLAVIESGKLALSPEPLSLANIMFECQTMFEPLSLKHDIHINFSPVESSLFVHADRIRLKQVLTNLISNAIKYNREHGTVEVKCAKTFDQRIRISIKDSGMGLTPEKLSQLFQPFNRLGQESGVVEGTGIGLVVTRRLVDLMDGTIGVESIVGEGSEFWIELNSDDRLQVKFIKATSEESLELVRCQEIVARRTLLYVEDNPANLMLVEQIMLEHPHISMFSARDGNHGVALARAHRPDVILMDINLPGINGIEAMNILRKDQATMHIPIIALSANAMLQDIEMGKDAGFFCYLTKPIKINEFMSALNSALLFAENGNKQNK